MNSQQLTPQTSYLEQNRFFMKVYGWMFLGLLVSAGVVFAIASIPAVGLLYINFLQATGRFALWILTGLQLMLVFMLRPNFERLSSPTGYATKFLLYAALTGVTLFSYFLAFDISGIVQAFVTASCLFAGMSMYGMLTKHDLSRIGQQAMGALIGVIIASLVNAFIFRSSMADLVVAIITVVIFLGLTAWDTQKMKIMYQEYGQSEVIKGLAIIMALELYLDFINLFLSLVRIFGKSRD